MLRLEVDRLRQLPQGASWAALSTAQQAHTPHISQMTTVSAGGQCIAQATVTPRVSERGEIVMAASGDTGRIQAESSMATSMETDMDMGSSSSNKGADDSSGERVHLYQQENMSGYAICEDKYRMESNPRGYMLIINNITFSNPEWNRAGAEADGENLISVFRQLGYLIEYQKDLTAQEMKDMVKTYSELDVHNHVDSCIMAILSHGDLNGMVYGVDGIRVNFKEMYGCFNIDKCPQLQGKPKLFILQACRGQRWNSSHVGTPESEFDVVPFDLQCETGQSDAGTHILLSPEISRSIPTNSDVILAYSTTEGEVSYRNTVQGSWYIEALTKVFKEYHRSKHVVDLLIKVNDMVASRHQSDSQGHQMPAPVIMTRKSWYFNAPAEKDV
ncbi:caspase-2-like isoform X2 [Liolophura sinensis]